MKTVESANGHAAVAEFPDRRHRNRRDGNREGGPSSSSSVTSRDAASEAIQPRLSTTQFGLYMTSGPAQRRRILRDAKNPQQYRSTYYDEARLCIAQYIGGGMSDPAILEKGIERLRDVPAASDQEEVRIHSNIDAIKFAAQSSDELRFRGLTPSVGAVSSPILDLEGVSISIRPEVLLAGRYCETDVVGGIRLHLSKQSPLHERSAGYLSTLVRVHLAKCPPAPGHRALHRCCMVYDVFAQRVFHAPESLQRRMADIEAACHEIVALWPTVE